MESSVIYFPSSSLSGMKIIIFRLEIESYITTKWQSKYYIYSAKLNNKNMYFGGYMHSVSFRHMIQYK